MSSLYLYLQMYVVVFLLFLDRFFIILHAWNVSGFGVLRSLRISSCPIFPALHNRGSFFVLKFFSWVELRSSEFGVGDNHRVFVIWGIEFFVWFFLWGFDKCYFRQKCANSQILCFLELRICGKLAPRSPPSRVRYYSVSVEWFCTSLSFFLPGFTPCWVL